MILTRSKMRILNFLWLKSTENITIFNYIPNTAPQFLQIKNYFHPKLEHISKTYIRCPRYSDRHCIWYRVLLDFVALATLLRRWDLFDQAGSLLYSTSNIFEQSRKQIKMKLSVEFKASLPLKICFLTLKNCTFFQ